MSQFEISVGKSRKQRELVGRRENNPHAPNPRAATAQIVSIDQNINGAVARSRLTLPRAEAVPVSRPMTKTTAHMRAQLRLQNQLSYLGDSFLYGSRFLGGVRRIHQLDRCKTILTLGAFKHGVDPSWQSKHRTATEGTSRSENRPARAWEIVRGYVPSVCTALTGATGPNFKTLPATW